MIRNLIFCVFCYKFCVFLYRIRTLLIIHISNYVKIPVHYTTVVNEKFKQFVTYLRQNCITNRFDAANILRKIYDKNEECKLIAYAFNNIVHNVT